MVILLTTAFLNKAALVSLEADFDYYSPVLLTRLFDVHSRN